MSRPTERKRVLIIPDGAPDVHRERGQSPLTLAEIRNADFIARQGVNGLMQTQYPELSKGSIVAQLGMLGWDPRRYYPHGRASCELLALGDVHLASDDLVFRANLVAMKGRKLVSYNAHYIRSEQAVPLVARINAATRERFPGFELYHNLDFRNSLVIRGAGVDPRLFLCAEPHDSEGLEFDPARMVGLKNGDGKGIGSRINEYLACANEVLAGETANMLFPWSASAPLNLPRFADHTGFQGKVGIVGCMDFLQGIARASRMDFHKVGNGSPYTDYEGKGAKVIELLKEGYSLVVCHINGPDEASHMGDPALKISSIEAIDQHIVGRVVRYFLDRPEELGGVMIAPDHYTNFGLAGSHVARGEAHSLHPVPFALWNGHERDSVTSYGEDAARDGLYANPPISHLDLLKILGVPKPSVAEALDPPRR
jgi:2,3-bisphosphoglycerate-independent phosphoglycerate mutase